MENYRDSTVFLAESTTITSSTNKYCQVSRCKSAPKQGLNELLKLLQQLTRALLQTCTLQLASCSGWHQAPWRGSSPPKVCQPRKPKLQALKSSREAKINDKPIYVELGEERTSQVKASLSVIWLLVSSLTDNIAKINNSVFHLSTVIRDLDEWGKLKSKNHS